METDNDCRESVGFTGVCSGSSENSSSGTTIADVFFEVLTENNSSNPNTITAQCVKCKPKVVKIRGFRSTTSNFISHLKRIHGEESVQEYKNLIGVKRREKQKGSSRLDALTTRLSTDSFHEDVVKFVIHSMIPLRSVEDPYFISIFKNFKHPGLTVISRRKLGRKIKSLFETFKTRITKELQETSFVCTTADIWAGKKRSFFGVTAHWISSNFERKSAALACRRFRNTHSYDRIADLLLSVHAEYGLGQDKIVATVTDNASNFVKAFKVYGVDIPCFNIEEKERVSDESSGTNSDSDTEGDIAPEAIELTLPTHLRCCAHTLSLCATSNAARVLENHKDLSNIHSSVIKKCNSLWKASGRPKSAEIMQNILGHTLSRPGETRWNSLYDSLRQIYSCSSKCAELFKALNIKGSFSERDIKYIEEHLQCAEPVAKALDLLQGENNTFYGIVLPCLLSLRRKLQHLTSKEWLYCKPLSEAFAKAVEERFADFFNFSTPVAERAALAALSYPRFKKRWFPCIPTQYQELLLKSFKKAVEREIVNDLVEDHQETILPNSTLKDDFFEFESPPTTCIQNQQSATELQILHFFADNKDELDMLNEYPAIRKVFMKYNSPLPSSAPVERLFSYATMTNLPKSHRLSDALFEERVLLKSNLK